MTKNRRYEAHYDELNDRAIERSMLELMPTTLPLPAYGPEPIVWAPRPQPEVWAPRPQPEVWAWISWVNAPASKIPAVAAGWNDRVVIVEWEAPGGRRSVVVWRTAVTRRTVPFNDESAPTQP